MTQQPLAFKSLRDLERDIRTKLLPQLPHGIGVVYGIPRSGMIPASILATALGAELGMVGGTTQFGYRQKYKLVPIGTKILLVDDSIHTGKAMQAARSLLSPDAPVYTCAVYTRPRTLGCIDFYAEIVDGPRVFQWNFTGIKATATYTWGMDDVICVRQVTRDVRGGGVPVKAIVDARPLYVPQLKVKSIVADRPRAWHQSTEGWLARHGIQYERLILRPSTASCRRTRSSIAKFKAEHYPADSPLFIEGDDALARAIAKLTSRPVLSVASMQLHGA